jgi:quercetin dioxygenase-like cupin family protein
MKSLFLFLMILLMAAPSALAQDQITVQTLSKGSVSWDGGSIQYPEGSPEITVVRIQVPEGAELSLHCHTVPLAAYVAKGAIEVTTSSNEKKIFRQGEAFIEVMNKWHRGLGAGKDTQLIVFYAGQKDIPLGVEKSGDPALTGKCN